MAKSTLTAAPGSANIVHTGHTTSGQFGSDPHNKGRMPAAARKLTK